MQPRLGVTEAVLLPLHLDYPWDMVWPSDEEYWALVSDMLGLESQFYHVREGGQSKVSASLSIKRDG